MESAEPFGARLRRIRKAKGIGVRELARRSGVNVSTVSETERGKIWAHGFPPVEQVRAYADALGVTREYLETGTNGAEALSSAPLEEANDVILAALVAEWRAQLGPEAIDRLREMSEVESPDVFRLVLREIAGAMAANAQKITSVAAILKVYRGEG